MARFITLSSTQVIFTAPSEIKSSKKVALEIGSSETYPGFLCKPLSEKAFSVSLSTFSVDVSFIFLSNRAFHDRSMCNKP